jgi:hypothetical protein
MDERIVYVERVLGFLYQQGFASKFEEIGSPSDDLEVWYKNAQVYQSVTQARLPRDSERVRLVTLIEAIRFEAMCPPVPGEPREFDVSAYEFSEDILAYKADVVEAVLRQEASCPSVLGP